MAQRAISPWRLLPLPWVVLAIAAARVLALQPDQIALVVNSNVPAGRKLADFYAEQRHIPADHIIELSLNVTGPDIPAEDISPTDYDEKVVPAVRNFLTSNALDKKVTCLVTFWGVPLRIGRRALTDADKTELADLKSELENLKPQIEKQVKSTEALAAEIDPEFKAGTAEDLDALAHRGEAALTLVLRKLLKIEDVKERGEAYEKMMVAVRDLAGQPAVADKLSQPDFWPIAPKKPTPEQVIDARQHTADLQKQINVIQALPQNAESRTKLRELFKAELGSLNSARLIVAQIKAADVTESESAFDSELALLWWPPYPKSRWELNPLDWHFAGRMALPGHTLMVTRLDGPSEHAVRDLITTSIKVEKEGLQGEVVLDARGKPPTEPYGAYDQTIRNLAEILRTRTDLKVRLDDKEPLIPQDSEKDIAIYCGWYSLRHYVSPGQFNPGAVGFHIASLEMVSLHNAKETGWCRNLLNAGVVGTLGPVAEPYLQSFPPADEFFPLLMTGKLTLAEVYWKTTPWSSWMQCCVADPLYTPYKTNPPLKVTDLPEQLKPLLR